MPGFVRSFLALPGQDEANGIAAVGVGDSSTTDSGAAWFSLDSRRLAAKPAKAGVYVRDGRKVVVK